MSPRKNRVTGRVSERASKLPGVVFTVAPPVTLRVVAHRAGHADIAELIPAARRLDGRPVDRTDEDSQTVYRDYRAMAVVPARAAFVPEDRLYLPAVDRRK